MMAPVVPRPNFRGRVWMGLVEKGMELIVGLLILKAVAEVARET